MQSQRSQSALNAVDDNDGCLVSSRTLVLMLRPVATLRHEQAVASSFLVDTNNFSEKIIKNLAKKCYKVKLILSKIMKIVANRRHILRLQCIKFDFGWGFAPDPAGGAHSAPPKH